MAAQEQVPRSSHSFACHTPAGVDDVWDALTSACRTPAYLYGLGLHSEWHVDAAIRADYDSSPTLAGQVVCCRRGERLSYLLQAATGDPATYLTWLLRPCPGGTTITLVVDEPDAPDTSDEAEDAWLPVLDALQHHLRHGAAPGAG